MGSGCSVQAHASVMVESSVSQHHRNSHHPAIEHSRDHGNTTTSSFLDSYRTPSPRLLQYLASNNTTNNSTDNNNNGNAIDHNYNNNNNNNEDDSSAEDVSLHYHTGMGIRPQQRPYNTQHHRPHTHTTRQEPSISTVATTGTTTPPPRRGLAGIAQRRRQRRRRQEEDDRFAEVLALQQSLAAMEDFFQSLLSHSHLLLEVMDPAGGGEDGTNTTMGGPPPASQAVLRNLPRRRWGDVQRQQQQQQQQMVCQKPCCSGGDAGDIGASSTPSDEKAVEEGTECGVCFEPHQEDDWVIELPCGHVYHVDCVEDWLQRHCTCPTCRYELPTDDVLFERGRKERMKNRATMTTTNHLTTTTTTSTPGVDEEVLRLMPTYDSPSATPFPATLSPGPSRNRMRNVMNESPSSWFIDHLQSRVEDDSFDDTYRSPRGLEFRPSSTLFPYSRPMMARYPSLMATSPATLPSTVEADIVVAPEVAAAVVATTNGEGDVAAPTAAPTVSSMASANGTDNSSDDDILITVVDDIAQEEAKRPAITHFPQQDTCAGIEGLDSLSSYADYGRAGATASTARTFSCDDGEDDMEEAVVGVK